MVFHYANASYPPAPFQRKRVTASAYPIRIIKPFPLVLRDFSTLLHIQFHTFCITKHQYNRSK